LIPARFLKASSCAALSKVEVLPFGALTENVFGAGFAPSAAASSLRTASIVESSP
jgi:hypothetical protein